MCSHVSLCPFKLLWLSQPSMCGWLRRQDNLKTNNQPQKSPLTTQIATFSRTYCIWQNLYCFDDILIKQTARVDPKAPRLWAKNPSSQKEYAIWIWGSPNECGLSLSDLLNSGVWQLCKGISWRCVLVSHLSV